MQIAVIEPEAGAALAKAVRASIEAFADVNIRTRLRDAYLLLRLDHLAHELGDELALKREQARTSLVSAAAPFRDSHPRLQGVHFDQDFIHVGLERDRL